MSQYTSWVIEACAQGNPYTIWVRPGTAVPLLYFKDAGQALVELGEAPLETIRTVVYLLAGVTPPPTAQELADAVGSKVPGAQITFVPDPAAQAVLDKISLPLDDTNARREWNWQPAYNLEQVVADFLQELRVSPERYA